MRKRRTFETPKYVATYDSGSFGSGSGYIKDIVNIQAVETYIPEYAAEAARYGPSELDKAMIRIRAEAEAIRRLDPNDAYCIVRSKMFGSSPIGFRWQRHIANDPLDVSCGSRIGELIHHYGMRTSDGSDRDSIAGVKVQAEWIKRLERVCEAARKDGKPIPHHLESSDPAGLIHLLASIGIPLYRSLNSERTSYMMIPMTIPDSARSAMRQPWNWEAYQGPYIGENERNNCWRYARRTSEAEAEAEAYAEADKRLAEAEA